MSDLRGTSLHEVVPHCGKLRVRRGVQPMWECEGRDEADRMRAFFADQFDSERMWISRRFRFFERPRPGYAIAVQKETGDQDASAILSDSKGVDIGGYHFRPNDDWAAYVMGEPTLSGSIALDSGYVGEGFGHLLYEAAAQACGCPPVPHARNGISGTLSDLASLYWGKRAKRTHVPGFEDPEVAARAAECAQQRLLFRAEKCLGQGDLCAAISDATGWRARGLFRSAGAGDPPEVAWCVLPDGTAFGSLQGLPHHGDALEWTARPPRNAPLRSGYRVRDLAGDDVNILRSDRSMAAAILDRYCGHFGLDLTHSPTP